MSKHTYTGTSTLLREHEGLRALFNAQPQAHLDACIVLPDR